MVLDPIIYQDSPGRRVLDLRPDGISCVPVLGISDFKSQRIGTEEHIHPGCLEICLCLKGNLAFESNGTIYPFLPGTIFVSTDQQPHRMRNNPKGLKLYRLLFFFPTSTKPILGFSKRESEWVVRSLRNLPKRVFAVTDKIQVAFERLFEIYDTMRPKSPHRTAALKTTVQELLISVIEAARRPPEKPPSIVDAAITFMREHPETTLSVPQLAARYQLAPVTFTNSFKQVTGLPPHAFLLDCRVKAAQKILRETNRPIRTIAAEFHFSSPNHFATVFKRTLGITPHQARNENDFHRA